jgi:hypothetical protein
MLSVGFFKGDISINVTFDPPPPKSRGTAPLNYEGQFVIRQHSQPVVWNYE